MWVLSCWQVAEQALLQSRVEDSRDALFGSVGVRTAPTLFHCQQRGLEWARAGPSLGKIGSDRPSPKLCATPSPPRRTATHSNTQQATFFRIGSLSWPGMCPRRHPPPRPTTARYLRLMCLIPFEFAADFEGRRRSGRRKEKRKRERMRKKMIGNSISNKLVDAHRPPPSLLPPHHRC